MRTSVADTQGTHGWSGSRNETQTRGVLQSRTPSSSERVGSFRVAAHLPERAAALVLLVLALPLLAALAALILLFDGRPVLYRGERLGQWKKPFWMSKLRTLRRGADRKTAARLLAPGDRLEIAGGRFMRETRLDELPQLWSIVRGDMSFIGPRPERPQVYEQHCRTIPGYEKRFAVRPGLIGPSQLFTPHSTPKRIRAWLDNTWSTGRRSPVASIGLTTYTALVVAGKVALRTGEVAKCVLLCRGVPKLFREKRRLRRVRPGAACVHLADPDATGAVTPAPLIDLNSEALLIRSPWSFPEGVRMRARLELELPGRDGSRRVRSADCEVVVVQRRPESGVYALVLAYTPASERSLYVLHQYFLRDSLAFPRPRKGSGHPAGPVDVLQGPEGLRPTPV